MNVSQKDNLVTQIKDMIAEGTIPKTSITVNLAAGSIVARRIPATSTWYNSSSPITPSAAAWTSYYCTSSPNTAFVTYR